MRILKLKGWLVESWIFHLRPRGLASLIIARQCQGEQSWACFRSEVNKVFDRRISRDGSTF